MLLQMVFLASFAVTVIVSLVAVLYKEKAYEYIGQQIRFPTNEFVSKYIIPFYDEWYLAEGIPEYVEQIGCMDGDAILELGCGAGLAIKEFSKGLNCTPSLIVGVDFSPIAVERAKANNKEGIEKGLVEIKLNEATSSLDFEDKTFNVVYSFNFINLWKNSARSIEESMRVLRDDGMLALCHRPEEADDMKIFLSGEEGSRGFYPVDHDSIVQGLVMFPGPNQRAVDDTYQCYLKIKGGETGDSLPVQVPDVKIEESGRQMNILDATIRPPYVPDDEKAQKRRRGYM